jgi:tetratricopeptide (TPR) repeat protein
VTNHGYLRCGSAARRLALRFLQPIAIGSLSLIAFAADQREEPVGLILTAGGSKLLRANTETPLNARDGDMLFAGDGLKTEGNAASFLFCPAKAIETLTASGEVRLESGQPRIKTGKLSQQPVRACALPPTLRVAVASQQHVGATMTRGVNKVEAPPIPRDKLPADVLAELGPESQEPAALAAAATVFEKHNLIGNAIESYSKLLALWPDAVWVKGKIFDLEQTLANQASATAATAPAGQTFALLIGISKYKRPELALQFADADAIDFSKLLETPRGGMVIPQNVVLLTDERATTAAIRNAFQDLLKRRASKNDTVVVLVAGHGTVEVPGSKGAFIVTYDSDPQDLTSTALPMGELRSLFEAQLKNVGHVVLFADVCKAGVIGSIKSTTVNSDVQNLGDVEGDLFGLLASRPKEVSIEGPQFGGGHGVFSYYVLKGLEGAADANKDGVVDANELIQYVTAQVATATENHQHPREFGTYDNALKLSDVTKPGNVVTWRILRDVRNGEPLYQASNAAVELEPQANESFDRFTSAIQAGRILPDQSDNAFDALKGIQSQVSQERYFEASNQLRIALENRAQDVLLRYLSGDQNPQNRQEFAQGARYMEAARTLTRESLFLEGREDFFQGRALLFDKKFPDAANLLEESVRIDPGAAYAYNALGIAYLEQGQFEKAIPAFRDAFRRAQHWSYPLHNEALARIETGDYQTAIRLYQQAMRLTPTYGYLPYNLGLVYQRLNRRKDAEVAYRKAIALAPDSAEPYNALGTLKNSEGKAGDAEKLYRDALQRNSNSLPSRHNLALLLASETNRRPEAIDLFRENLRQSPEYLPSRLSLAETLGSSNVAGDRAIAIEEYRRVLALKPAYVGARLALADLLAKSGDNEGAVNELRSASQADPANFAIFEQIGDIEAARGRTAEARAAYTSALNAASDRAAHKRIDGKMKGLH